MIKLQDKIRLQIKDGDETLVRAEFIVKKLKKKQQRKIQEQLQSVQELVEDDAIEALDILEEVSKERFYETVTGDEEDINKLIEFAEDYGYTLLMQTIDEEIEKSRSKGK